RDPGLRPRGRALRLSGARGRPDPRRSRGAPADPALARRGGDGARARRPARRRHAGRAARAVGPTPAVSEGPIEVVPATPDRWDDVATVLGGSGDRGCWCPAPRGRVAGGRNAPPGVRRSALREQLAEDPPPGMLAYV